MGGGVWADRERPAGVTEDSGYEVAVVFRENIRDAAHVYGHDAGNIERQAVAHEIGHEVLGSNQHTASTIMNVALPVPSTQWKFTMPISSPSGLGLPLRREDSSCQIGRTDIRSILKILFWADAL